MDPKCQGDRDMQLNFYRNITKFFQENKLVHPLQSNFIMESDFSQASQKAMFNKNAEQIKDTIPDEINMSMVSNIELNKSIYSDDLVVKEIEIIEDINQK